MKKGVLVLILFAVLIIIVSPGLVGRLAEDSVGENLNRVAQQGSELLVTSSGFERGWFSSEGQHRVEIGDGELRSTLMAAAGNDDALPALLIDTHIDHGLIPVSSMGRDEGSLLPGLGSAVSTLSIESGAGERVELPGTVYSSVSLGGDLESRYLVEAGARTVDDGEVTWQPTTISLASSASTENIGFDGDIGAMTFGNDQQTVSIDGLTFSGQQVTTEYGFNVGNLDMTMGAISITAGGQQTGGMRSLSLTASSSIDNGDTAAELRLEMSGQTVPGFGDVSIIADMDFAGLDAAALGAVSQQLDGLSGTQDASQVLAAAGEDLKDLLAAGLSIGVDQFDVALPMGTVEMKMALEVPESDRTNFEWASLLLGTTGALDIRIPESLVQLASSMDPQFGALVGMGYLKKDGDVYILDADLKKGLLTINGAPMPMPLGAFQ